MIPYIWGPSLWEALFCCAWFCGMDEYERFWKFLVEDLSSLLPCPVCRIHYNLSKTSLPKPCLQTHGSIMLWLYNIRTSINKRAKTNNLTISMLRSRMDFHAASVLNAPRLADVLVLIAIHSEGKTENEFVRLVHILSRFLPSPPILAFSTVSER